MVDDGRMLRKWENKRSCLFFQVSVCLPLLSCESCAKLPDVLVTSRSSLENYQDDNKTDGRTDGRAELATAKGLSSTSFSILCVHVCSPVLCLFLHSPASVPTFPPLLCPPVPAVVLD